MRMALTDNAGARWSVLRCTFTGPEETEKFSHQFGVTGLQSCVESQSANTAVATFMSPPLYAL